MVQDPVKGRCLAAKVAIPGGTVIFEEPAAVFASADDDDQDINRDLLASFGDVHPLALLFAQLADAMADLDRVESLNMTRNWLQLVALMLMLTPDPALADAVKPLVLSLEAKNLDEFLASVKAFRASAPPPNCSVLTRATWPARPYATLQHAPSLLHPPLCPRAPGPPRLSQTAPGPHPITAGIPLNTKRRHRPPLRGGRL